MKHDPSETRSRILDSVMQLILLGGVQAVTLSAVCQKSKLSKGGLVHYFPSKESLIEAFIQRSANQYLDMIESTLHSIPAGSGKRALAFVNQFFSEAKLLNDNPNDDCVAVMVALIQGGQRGSTLKKIFETVHQSLKSDGISIELATTILVALDGLWFESVIEESQEIAKRARRIRVFLRDRIKCEIESKRNRVKRTPVKQRRRSEQP